MIKTLISAIVLAVASFTIVSNSYAMPKPFTSSERMWFDHASRPVGGGGF